MSNKPERAHNAFAKAIVFFQEELNRSQSPTLNLLFNSIIARLVTTNETFHKLNIGFSERIMKGQSSFQIVQNHVTSTNSDLEKIVKNGSRDEYLSPEVLKAFENENRMNEIMIAMVLKQNEVRTDWFNHLKDVLSDVYVEFVNINASKDTLEKLGETLKMLCSLFLPEDVNFLRELYEIWKARPSFDEAVEKITWLDSYNSRLLFLQILLNQFFGRF
ncbi:MAG TPA: hypothetical protein VFI06_03285 [Chitinophagaceae bacterium]|nr:hypothetical protein [Chitinophagaceae bacterium]